MSKNKISKEDLKSPDAFMSFADRVASWIAERAKPLGVIVGLIIVLAIGYTTLSMIQSSQEKTASAALFQFEKKIDEVKLAQAKRQRELIEKLSAPEKESEEKINETIQSVPELDFERDFAVNAAAWGTTIKEYSNTQSAQLARIRLARLYLDYDKADLAEPVLRAAIDDSKKGTSTYGLARTMLASVLSYQDKIPEARELLQQVVDEPSLSYLHSEALLKLGVLNQEAGDSKLAEEMFRRVTTEFADTEAGETAKLYLRLIQFVKPQVEVDNKATSVEP